MLGSRSYDFLFLSNKAFNSKFIHSFVLKLLSVFYEVKDKQTQTLMILDVLFQISLPLFPRMRWSLDFLSFSSSLSSSLVQNKPDFFKFCDLFQFSFILIGIAYA